jgi:hypothetical protein
MKMKSWIGLAAAVFILGVTGGMAADFDGDGVADEFTLTREIDKVASDSGVRLVNPWNTAKASKKPAKALGFIVRLSRTPQTYLLHDADFFDTPIWKEGKSRPGSTSCFIGMANDGSSSGRTKSREGFRAMSATSAMKEKPHDQEKAD